MPTTTLAVVSRIPINLIGSFYALIMSELPNRLYVDNTTVNQQVGFQNPSVIDQKAFLRVVFQVLDAVASREIREVQNTVGYDVVCNHGFQFSVVERVKPTSDLVHRFVVWQQDRDVLQRLEQARQLSLLDQRPEPIKVLAEPGRFREAVRQNEVLVQDSTRNGSRGPAPSSLTAAPRVTFVRNGGFRMEWAISPPSSFNRASPEAYTPGKKWYFMTPLAISGSTAPRSMPQFVRYSNAASVMAKRVEFLVASKSASRSSLISMSCSAESDPWLARTCRSDLAARQGTRTRVASVFACMPWGEWTMEN
ncbi:hypothetical protein PoMZ_11783 [Pyricularia oryzae]|uniref:Uncharacterized protein n=1 Tax=Pyricularia oryzae TaxID=318829 RepID=A0A4P7NL88_PYROR|nr:hypothetical protein PoMZ_11783 [Pyricularia oryzae]